MARFRRVTRSRIVLGGGPAVARVHGAEHGERPAQQLVGFARPIVGRADTITRGIAVSNAAASAQGLPSVTAVSTRVRLAQGVPVRIRITGAPSGIPPVSGLTATVTLRKNPPADAGAQAHIATLMSSVHDVFAPPPPSPDCRPAAAGGTGPEARFPAPTAAQPRIPEQIAPLARRRADVEAETALSGMRPMTHADVTNRSDPARSRPGRSPRSGGPAGGAVVRANPRSHPRHLPDTVLGGRTAVTRTGSRLARLAVPVALGLCLSGCTLRVLDPAGPVLAGERTILLNALAIMLCIVVPTMLATLAVVWWFRPGNPRARRRPTWSFSGRIEIVTWSIPLMTIVFLGGLAWIGSHDLDPAKPLRSERKPLEVQVVSLDWKWLFLYPEQKVASLNRLVLPVGTPVRFRLTSASVWNAFFVPRLGSMIYTMSGMVTQLHLQADREGSFLGLSAMISGDGFADMHFETSAVSPDAFAQWVTQAQGSAQALDDAAYRTLSRQSLKHPPTTYRLADDALFDRIVGQVLPPGPGPEQGRPDPTVKPTTTLTRQGP